MKTNLSRRTKGFGLTEAIIVTVILAVLLAFYVRSLRPKRRGCCAPNCVNNQKQLGIAFRGFGIDMGGFPMVVSANTNGTNEPLDAGNDLSMDPVAAR